MAAEAEAADAGDGERPPSRTGSTMSPPPPLSREKSRDEPPDESRGEGDTDRERLRREEFFLGKRSWGEEGEVGEG